MKVKLIFFATCLTAVFSAPLEAQARRGTVGELVKQSEQLTSDFFRTTHQFSGSRRTRVLAKAAVGGTLSELIGRPAAVFTEFVQKQPATQLLSTAKSVDQASPRSVEWQPVESLQTNDVPSEFQVADQLTRVKAPATELSAMMNQQEVMAVEPSLTNVEDGAPLSESAETSLRTPRLSGAESIPYVVKKSQHVGYGDMALTFVDDRSNGRANKYYPATGVNVELIAANFSAITDGQGQVKLHDLPMPGRYLVRTSDYSGTYAPSYFSLNNRQSRHRLLLMRKSLLQAYQEVLGIVQYEDRASLCVTVYGEDGKSPAKNIALTTDMNVDGPYYFNQYGFLNAESSATSANGRACFFNVAPGIVNLFISAEGLPFTAVTTSSVAGHHIEEVIDLKERYPLSLRVAAAATAYEELSSDTIPQLKNGMLVDYADMFSLGSEDPMVQVAARGQVSSPDPTLFMHGKAQVVAMNGEFEDALYQFDSKAPAEEQIAMLHPRGFLEDISVYANADYNPALGTVLLWHYSFAKHNNIKLDVELVPVTGGEASAGWVYSEGDILKTVFFNVPSGLYQIVVKSTNGYWIASEVAQVYDQMMTVLNTGSTRRIHD